MQIQKRDALSRKYSKVTPEIRASVIHQATQEDMPIKMVAERYNIKLGTCYAIIKVFKTQGRTTKKETRKKKTILETKVNFLVKHPLQMTSTLPPLSIITSTHVINQQYNKNKVLNELNDCQQNDNENIPQIRSTIKTIYDEMQKGLVRALQLQQNPGFRKVLETIIVSFKTKASQPDQAQKQQVQQSIPNLSIIIKDILNLLMQQQNQFAPQLNPAQYQLLALQNQIRQLVQIQFVNSLLNQKREIKQEQ